MGGEKRGRSEDGNDDTLPVASTSDAYAPPPVSSAGAGAVAKETTFAAATSGAPLKRKHSPYNSASHSPAPPQPLQLQQLQLQLQPQPHHDPPIEVAPLPILSAHTAHLPPSPFEFFSTSKNHANNKRDYRYTPCGPSSNPEAAHLPVQMHRFIESVPQAVRWSWEDRSLFVLVTQDAKTVTTDKGWRAVRANVPVREGSWYWEIKVERGGGEGGRDFPGGVGEGSWCRVGVGRRESPLNAPVGFDGYSYAYRDRLGDAVTLSRPKPYGKAYGSHSTIGVYLSLPPRPPADPSDRRDPARIVRKRVAIRYKGQLFFESLEYTPSKEMDDLNVDPATKAKVVVEEKKAAAPGTKARPPVEDLTPPPRPLPKLAQARLAFFLDGECQGVAFEDLYDFLPLRLHPGGLSRKDTRDFRENWHDDGMLGYFPFVSVFGGAIATINPGPDFEFPPPDNIEAVLATSPHPPTSPPIVFPEDRQPSSSPSASSARAWRPLSDRYLEFLAEQNYLDDMDELEVIRVYQAEAEAEAAKKAEAQAAAAALSAASKGPPPPHATPEPSLSEERASKKPIVVAVAVGGGDDDEAGLSAKVLAELGAVKREDVLTLGSPASIQGSRTASPAPQQAMAMGTPLSLAHQMGGENPSTLTREVVPESEDEREREEVVKMES